MNEAYTTLSPLMEKQLDALIGTLILEAITGYPHRDTPLVRLLATELGVSIRKKWTPSAEWLAGYQKVQLAHLMGVLRGPAHGSAALSRKKSELVTELDTLFGQPVAAPKELGNHELADRVNTWMPKPSDR
ncbi:MAG: hypothetical protein KF691_03390 [Phycisphaeraceae bacterium]|nr:hypothetical protein [Phycisphaeraceae bacterium]